ncbi:ribosomal protein L21 [Candidatus Endolissoclinum faulkneri L2]|uniref:Large ribosomal subunit protein bL21 n=1 Tax=Candidatus Endolissoclinum faulkneri L2 TaxID=1193729 RepID=K7Z590_9PROT|nr:50S ribosomal protein L21 [Candidatus Endolissoclinum faulkneri]AFX99218.1 ribosomal protein L21 [Candidatus Endolissoclinum faulkneri L2]
MLAVVKTGGKQYRVAYGDIIKVEHIEAVIGTKVEINEILLINTDSQLTVGSPLVFGASIACEVLDQRKDPKIIVFKKKRRKNHRRTHGHRQNVTVLRVIGINAGA